MKKNEQGVYPYKKTGSKKEQVAEMFNNISGRYDFLNHFLSLGIDKIWRNHVIKIIKKENPETILDVATGTGDLAIKAASSLKNAKVTGIDISEKMLEKAQHKLDKMNSINVEFAKEDAENLPFHDEQFDIVMVAFGVRNFEDIEKGITEIRRVLKNDGLLLILEFSKPKVFPLKQFFLIYFKFILPLLGKMISKDQRAYKYLPESVQEFPAGRHFLDILKHLKFKKVQCKPLSFGISSIYLGRK